MTIVSIFAPCKSRVFCRSAVHNRQFPICFGPFNRQSAFGNRLVPGPYLLAYSVVKQRGFVNSLMRQISNPRFAIRNCLSPLTGRIRHLRARTARNGVCHKDHEGHKAFSRPEDTGRSIFFILPRDAASEPAELRAQSGN